MNGNVGEKCVDRSSLVSDGPCPSLGRGIALPAEPFKLSEEDCQWRW